MASSEVDQKFLGKIAKDVEKDNPLLSQMLFKILGLSLNLSEQLIAAKKQRRPDPSRVPEFLNLAYHILWLSREGLNMLEQYVLPKVGNNDVLIVLAHKLRASFLHIYVLFHNTPSVSSMNVANHELHSTLPLKVDKGKGRATEEDYMASQSSIQPTHALEGGPVGPPPGFGPRPPNPNLPFVRPKLLRDGNYLPKAHEYFETAARHADTLLWGSHTLRLSVKTEYAAFLYDCVHDAEASRRLARETIDQVFTAQEGMDDDMFEDACELVAVLGKMKHRGQGSSRQDSSPGRNTAGSSLAGSAPPGMENAI